MEERVRVQEYKNHADFSSVFVYIILSLLLFYCLLVSMWSDSLIKVNQLWAAAVCRASWTYRRLSLITLILKETSEQEDSQAGSAAVRIMTSLGSESHTEWFHSDLSVWKEGVTFLLQIAQFTSFHSLESRMEIRTFYDDLTRSCYLSLTSETSPPVSLLWVN